MLIKIKILKRINEVTYACSLTQNRTFKAVMKNKNGGGLDGDITASRDLAMKRFTSINSK